MPFPFLQLPTEIRLPIYRLLLPYSEYHLEEQEKDTPVRWYQGRYHCPNILHVNRQIHSEAAEILYQENYFGIYVKHPQQPRLPLNESRADSESFMFISWAKSTKTVLPMSDRFWAHPQNPRLPLSILRSHQDFHLIRKLHVSLLPLDGLSGVDMFMMKTSFAAFYGVNAWLEHRAKKGGSLDLAEKERMSIVQQFKSPIDELGRLLQKSERIDHLCISVQVSRFQITFSEYLVEELLKVDVVGGVDCYLASTYGKVCGTTDRSQLTRWENLLGQEPKVRRKESQLPPGTDGMYRLLQAIRTYQQICPKGMPDWLSPMPA